MNKTIILKRKTDIKMNRYHARAVTMTAMLAAVSYIFAFVEFPVPLSPAFARMDLSDFPALVGAFAFGPVSGIMIELVKKWAAAAIHFNGRCWGVGKFPHRGFLCMGGGLYL